MIKQLKLTEVAQRLGVSEKTARRYVKAGVLPSVFVGNAYRVDERDLEEYLERARVTPGKAPAPPPQRSLFNGLEEERRRTFVQSCRQYAQTRAEHYERRLAEAQEGGVFAGREGARILFEAALEEYDELRPLFGRDLAYLLAEGLPDYEASRFSGLTVVALFPLAETVERIADRAAELAETEAQKAEVERRREEMRRSA